MTKATRAKENASLQHFDQRMKFTPVASTCLAKSTQPRRERAGQPIQSIVFTNKKASTSEWIRKSRRQNFGGCRVRLEANFEGRTTTASERGCF
ncbi:hypothetical protein CGZ80_09130 [Rhodopirellula sp. MGV]|nr:hypothetical protein CGZ80_09130 [Rhodopirellula sp. MGV]PNY34898.1 hypothetical protein C2E31_21140 [Rhodopirellula baltica]